MRVILILFLTLQLYASGCQSQGATQSIYQTEDPEFKKTIDSYLDFDIPLTTVDVLRNMTTPHIILDAREKKEFNVSHIPDAQYLGYKNADYTVLDNVDKNDLIVVYCSIGYRSEKISQKLKKKGFKNVVNLYGSIFEWANKGYPLHDNQGDLVTRVHGYNKKWSQWVDNEGIEVVY